MAEALVEQGVTYQGQAGTQGRAQKRRTGAGDQFHAVEGAGSHREAPATMTYEEQWRSAPVECCKA
jgi:hypothetical protein